MKHLTALLTLLIISLSGFTQDADSELITAIENGNEKQVFYLLKAGADANYKTAYGISALMYAADKGNIYIVKTLLKYGADADYKPDYELPALHSAVKKNHVEIAELLINAGANVNSKDIDDNYPLIYAAEYGYPLMTDILCNAGADTEVSVNGWTPLMFAAYYNDTEITEILLKYSANIEAKNNSGFTALMLSAQEGCPEEVKLLVSQGAKISERNNDGLTALDLAVYRNHEDIVNYLLEQGAKPAKIDKKNSTLTLAENIGNNNMLDLLNQETVKNQSTLRFGKTFFGISNHISNGDYMFGIQSGFSELNTKTDLIFAYDIRPYRKKVLIEKTEHEFWQYREFRNSFSISLQKRIQVKRTAQSQIGILIGAKGSYYFGGYKGSSEQLSEFCPIPKIGIYRQSKNTRLTFSYEYTTFAAQNLSSNIFSLSWSHIFNPTIYVNEASPRD